MNADGTNPVQLTAIAATDATPQWSPDGNDLVFTRALSAGSGQIQLFIMKADGTGPTTQVTAPDEGVNAAPSWDLVRVRVP